MPWIHFKLLASVTSLLTAASLADAALSLSFDYNWVDDATTVSYTGTMGLEADNSASTNAVSEVTNTTFASHGGGTYGAATDVSIEPLPWQPVIALSGSGQSGDTLIIDSNANLVGGPSGYTTTTPIIGSLVLPGTDLSDLGFAGSSGVQSFAITGADAPLADPKPLTLEVTVTWSTVPEPGLYATLFGLTGLCLAAWRRRRHD
jgi:MYXO-CTERM domain-containing protein